MPLLRMLNRIAYDDFYDQLQSALEYVPKQDLMTGMGEWNADVGQVEETMEEAAGKNPLKRA